ncbi:MAG TPA: hypothetical protein VNB29_06655, partial [Chthoniobacterales bacterium]|nr:hypothetical protein [Chthoniobacterales bacterium]
FGSRVIASVIGILFLQNPFVHAHATRHLLTEPLHLLLAVTLLFVVADYLLRRKPGTLVLAGALAGLDYLTRPNGLFIFASLVASLGLYEGWRLYRVPWKVRSEGMAIALSAALAILAFIAVSAPSWIPRYEYFGNPIHHGYLTNYLWTDSYKEGHVGQRFAIYSSKDYFASHGVKDVVLRWAHGIGECGFTIPIRTEGRWPALYFLALAGFLMTLWKGAPACRVLALFGTLQMLPLVWTNLSNPTIRVPYAAELPFELIFAAIFLHELPRLRDAALAFLGTLPRRRRCRILSALPG